MRIAQERPAFRHAPLVCRVNRLSPRPDLRTNQLHSHATIASSPLCVSPVPVVSPCVVFLPGVRVGSGR